MRCCLDLNSDAFRNAKKLSEEYNKLVEKKWFVQGTTYNSIVKHELGHLYQAIHNISNKRIVEIAMQVSSIDDESTLFKFLNDNLSEYSGSLIDGSEIISEVFSDYFGNCNPTEFSKKFMGDLIKLRGE